jgi:hypothetical protein
MISFTRPTAPPAFAIPCSRAVQKARDDIAKNILAGISPSFPSHWSNDEGRRRLLTAQSNKCAYCENLLITNPPEVDHYAPKGEIEELLSLGQEKSGLINVIGRKTRSIYTLGYWWMAYQWNNYLMVCDRCNSAWKGSIFPVANIPRKKPPKSEDEVHIEGWPWLRETPLLINPFDAIDLPSHHFAYGIFGEIIGLTRMGLETIKICGLDRPSLRQQRRTVYEQNQKRLKNLAIAPDSLKPFIINDILDAENDRATFAGVVRWLVAQRFDMKWSEFVTYASKLTP